VSHICKCSLARSCYSQTHLLGIAVATSKESRLPVCRHQAEPHAQIQKSIDRIGDGTATSDQSVAVLHLVYTELGVECQAFVAPYPF